MLRTLLGAGALSLALGLTAQAQTPAGQPVNPKTPAPPATAATAPSAAADTSASASAFRSGMTVKDAQGTTIGTISRVIKTPDGATTYAVSVDGRTINLPGSALSLGAAGEAISSMSKAQITASTAPPTT
jgi:hypothetical protein